MEPDFKTFNEESESWKTGQKTHKDPYGAKGRLMEGLSKY